MLHSCIKGFLRAKKLWVNPPKAERAKPSLSSDYNLLFKNKIGERSLDIHRKKELFRVLGVPVPTAEQVFERDEVAEAPEEVHDIEELAAEMVNDDIDEL